MSKKDLKITIKNTQLAKALELGKLKEKLAQKKAEGAFEKEAPKHEKEKVALAPHEETLPVEGQEAPRRKARTKSAFEEHKSEEHVFEKEPVKAPEVIEEPKPLPVIVPEPVVEAPKVEEVKQPEPPKIVHEPPKVLEPQAPKKSFREQLGPTGRHVKDLLPVKKVVSKPPETKTGPSTGDKKVEPSKTVETDEKKGWAKGSKVKEFKDLKPAKKGGGRFDKGPATRSLNGDDEQRWRKKKGLKGLKGLTEEATIRPTELSIRLPTTIKDLAQEMKLKASELIQKLFLQGVMVTINDVLEDPTTVELLGVEFGCQIKIDTSEEERIKITGKTIREEILGTVNDELILRAPVVAFMGHVDHGKTSLIDAIRKSNRAAGEAGAITQHIGAFKCKTAIGAITILDTPGHEAFSAMRARGAVVTDIVVLVVAGDEGMRAQTIEAMQHAKAAGVTIVVAANKCDKPNFDLDKILRQLADNDLLPESWGGQTIVVKCSAVTGEGIKELLEMLALQAEVLELKANPKARARGIVLESEMHKGLGMVANMIVLNGTLRQGDAIVFEDSWARVKTLFDELGKTLPEAGPSTPVEITGLSALPEAGEEFIVVPHEQEAKSIAEARLQGKKNLSLQQRRPQGLESLLQQSAGKEKKVLKVLLRADVQGSLEALKAAIEKIQSDKADAEVIFTGVGEITESDVQLAQASNAVVIGFHVQVESHADPLVKQYGVQVRLHDIIYHAIDDVKAIMTNMLDKIVIEVEKGKAEIIQIFKSSQYGNIAGCKVTEGSIHRNHHVRLKRDNAVIWQGTISGIRRERDEVREVQKGFECGITFNGFNAIQLGDTIETFEISYKAQEL